jgi:hypothetical protein
LLPGKYLGAPKSRESVGFLELLVAPFDNAIEPSAPDSLNPSSSPTNSSLRNRIHLRIRFLRLTLYATTALQASQLGKCLMNLWLSAGRFENRLQGFGAAVIMANSCD